MNFQELKAIALANPKGKIVKHHSLEWEFPKMDNRNFGNWNGTDSTRDIFEDFKQAVFRLSSIPKTIIGSHETLKPLLDTDPYKEYSRSNLLDGYQYAQVWESIMPLFYQSLNMFPDKGFIQFDDSADPGIVLLVGTEGDVVYIDTR
jgi:hypothetical protein